MQMFSVFLEVGHIKRHVYVYLKPTDPKMRNLLLLGLFSEMYCQ